MVAEKMPGLAELIKRNREKSQVFRNLLDQYSNDVIGFGEEARMLKAVGRIAPQQLCRERIPAAVAELVEIRAHTELSANTIMERAESLMDDASDDAVSILEACTFQDIVGQRVTKVIDLLETIEIRLYDLVAETGVKDAACQMGVEEQAAERHRKEQLLHGPQLAGEALDQSDIDALLGA